MTTARISNKGQITLPAVARRKLGIEPLSSVEIEVRNAEIVIRAIRPVSEAKGIFRRYAKDEPEDWDTVRTCVEQAVAGEIERG